MKPPKEDEEVEEEVMEISKNDEEDITASPVEQTSKKNSIHPMFGKSSSVCVVVSAAYQWLQLLLVKIKLLMEHQKMGNS